MLRTSNSVQCTAIFIEQQFHVLSCYPQLYPLPSAFSFLFLIGYSCFFPNPVNPHLLYPAKPHLLYEDLFTSLEIKVEG